MPLKLGGIMAGGLAVVFALAVLSAPPGAWGGVFYLSPDGDDDNPGTRGAPWRTLEKASDAGAGDTVILLKGEYPGVLRPGNSGTADAPITFMSAERRGAVLYGCGEADCTVNISEVSRIRIEGLRVTSRAGRRWLKVENSSHVDITDCLFEDEKVNMRWEPARISNSEQVRLRGSVFRRVHGDMLIIDNSRRVLLEGNSISKAGHCPFLIRDSSYVVVRGSVFHGGWGRNLGFLRSENLLFENNILTNAVNSGRSNSSASSLLSRRAIFRFNRVFRNWGATIWAGPWRDDMFFSGQRFYNNVFDDNCSLAMTIVTSHDNVNDVVLQNNVFSRNDRWGDFCQLALRGGGPEKARLLNNVIVGDEPGGLSVVRDSPARRGGGLSLEKAQSDGWISERGRRYEGNLDVVPGYAAPETYNHALLENSPLRSAGSHLTRTAGAGAGTELPVKDALFFYDGFGIEGEAGDLIAVKSPCQVARITGIDRENNKLMLDRPLRWGEGDPVSLPWEGSAPDIGVYEHGASGRAMVQVITEPFTAAPGGEIRLRAVTHGNIRAGRVTWRLGDGTAAEGEEVVHRYAAEDDYPVIAKLVAADGGEHVAAGYVVVEQPRDPAEPLVHSTFDSDDEDWWRRWQTYRPARGKTKWERVLDRSTGRGYMRVEAPEDGARMPFWTMPPGWDIDSHPLIRIRYRVGEGAPAALYLRAFRTVENTDRKAYVALAPEAEIQAGRRAAENVLHDDEKWHELEVDARLIRKLFPDVRVLEALRLDSARRGAAAMSREGHWFEVEEVYIGPPE